MKILPVSITPLLLSIFFQARYTFAELWEISNLTLSGNPQFNILQSNDNRFDFTVKQSPNHSVRCVKDFVNFSWLYNNTSNYTKDWHDCQTDIDNAAVSLRWRALNFTHDNGQPRAFILEIGRFSNNIKL
jgi:hypothetical protein